MIMIYLLVCETNFASKFFAKSIQRCHFSTYFFNNNVFFTVEHCIKHICLDSFYTTNSHFSLLPHPSSFILRPSFLISRPSSLIPYHSSHISHPSSIIPHPLFLIPKHKSLIPHLLALALVTPYPLTPNP